MIEFIVAWLNGITPELGVFLLAMMPVGELRAAIPIGVTVYELSLYQSLFYAYLGNIVPIFFIFSLLPWVISFTKKRVSGVEKVLDKYFLTLEKKYKEKYDRYGSLALVLLVAVPLPGSGVWTAAFIAVLVGVEKKYAIPAILLGLAIAGGIVTLITEGALGALQFLI